MKTNTQTYAGNKAFPQFTGNSDSLEIRFKDHENEGNERVYGEYKIVSKSCHAFCKKQNHLPDFGRTFVWSFILTHYQCKAFQNNTLYF